MNKGEVPQDITSVVMDFSCHLK